MSIRKLIAIATAILAVGISSTAAAAATPNPAAHPRVNTLNAVSFDGTYALLNHGQTPMAMNGNGGSCAPNTAVIGWPTRYGTSDNEYFNVYSDGSVYEYQAAWCPQNGYANSGMCVADDATRYHLLHLAACNFNSKWDTFQNVSSGNVANLINLEYSSYLTANNSAGGQMWDGNYVYGNSDWGYLCIAAC